MQGKVGEHGPLPGPAERKAIPSAYASTAPSSLIWIGPPISAE